MIDPSDIEEHMEVVGSDGEHVGTVDHLAIKMTKSDPSAYGEHHIIPLDMVDSIEDGKLVLNMTAEEATGEEEELDE